MNCYSQAGPRDFSLGVCFYISFVLRRFDFSRRFDMIEADICRFILTTSISVEMHCSASTQRISAMCFTICIFFLSQISQILEIFEVLFNIKHICRDALQCVYTTYIRNVFYNMCFFLSQISQILEILEISVVLFQHKEYLQRRTAVRLRNVYPQCVLHFSLADFLYQMRINDTLDALQCVSTISMRKKNLI